MMHISPCKSYLSRITVFQNPVSRTRGIVIAGQQIFTCSLGRSGVRHLKREGDGGTPPGLYRLHGLWWRADRHPRPPSGFIARPISRRDGWCEDSRSPCYNRAVRLPHPAAHETMHREDRLYDYVLEIGYNMGPVKKGRGSAIFLHLARNAFAPTAGCVGISPNRIRHLLARIGPGTTIRIV